ncbi:hypothetical protein Dimus_012865 [Dionaea muscipula]
MTEIEQLANVNNLDAAESALKEAIIEGAIELLETPALRRRAAALPQELREAVAYFLELSHMTPRRLPRSDPAYNSNAAFSVCLSPYGLSIPLICCYCRHCYDHYQQRLLLSGAGDDQARTVAENLIAGYYGKTIATLTFEDSWPVILKKRREIAMEREVVIARILAAKEKAEAGAVHDQNPEGHEGVIRRLLNKLRDVLVVCKLIPPLGPAESEPG